MESEDDRLKKQIFLKTEILDTGYDGQKFQDFLNSQKNEGGSNIDIWSLEELSNIVKEFKKSQDDENIIVASSFNSQDNFSPLKAPSKKIKKTFTIDRKDELVDNNKNMISLENYEKVIPCRSILKSIITEEDPVEIDIVNFEVKSGSFFSTGYALFKIETKSIENWVVYRRFSEFFSLRTFFLKSFPGIMIPPIPGKKISGNLETGFLFNRRSFLEKFLRDVAATPILKTSKLFMDFLSLDEGKFKDRLQETEKFIKMETVEQYNTYTGNAILTINEPIKKYTKNAGDYVKNADLLYQKLTKLNRQLMIEFDQINITIFNISEVFRGLHFCSLTFNETLDKKTQIEDVYLTFNNLMVDWGNKMVEETHTIENCLSHFFKYEKNYNEVLKDLISERNNCGNDFYECDKKLKKSQMENQNGTTSKLSNIFKKDGEKLEKTLVNLRDKFAFFNQSVFEEIDRCLNEKNKRYIKDLENFILEKRKLKKNEESLWTCYEKEIKGLKNGEKSQLSIKKVEIKQAINPKIKETEKKKK